MELVKPVHWERTRVWPGNQNASNVKTRKQLERLDPCHLYTVVSVCRERLYQHFHTSIWTRRNKLVV